MRDEVLRFAIACDRAIGKNFAKGHWRKTTAPYDRLVQRMQRARLRLELDVKKLHPRMPATGRERIDILASATSVANYAMMVADCVGAIPELL